MINKAFNIVAHIFNVPEKTEALTRDLANGMKKLGIKALNGIYDTLDSIAPSQQQPAVIRVDNRHAPQHRR